MTRPETPYEAASYDLNKFRERRMADRRFSPRDAIDRRALQTEPDTMQKPARSAADSDMQADQKSI